jgi:hypothetical protein
VSPLLKEESGNDSAVPLLLIDAITLSISIRRRTFLWRGRSPPSNAKLRSCKSPPFYVNDNFGQ